MGRFGDDGRMEAGEFDQIRARTKCWGLVNILEFRVVQQNLQDSGGWEDGCWWCLLLRSWQSGTTQDRGHTVGVLRTHSVWVCAD